MHEMDLPQLVETAAAGDEAAWQELVRRYQALVWATIRKVRISSEDAEDASQLTWLQLSLNIGKLREPAAIGGWLVTVARREALRFANMRPTQPLEEDLDAPSDDPQPIDDVLRTELKEQVRQGWLKLDERCRQLLGMLADDPPASYLEVSETLSMPLGSVGPVRSRCLERLRRAAGI